MIPIYADMEIDQQLGPRIRTLAPAVALVYRGAHGGMESLQRHIVYADHYRYNWRHTTANYLDTRVQGGTDDAG